MERYFQVKKIVRKGKKKIFLNALAVGLIT